MPTLISWLHALDVDTASHDFGAQQPSLDGHPCACVVYEHIPFNAAVQLLDDVCVPVYAEHPCTSQQPTSLKLFTCPDGDQSPSPWIKHPGFWFALFGFQL